MQIVSAPCVFLDETDNIKTHCSRSQRSDSNAESNAEEKPTSHRWFGGNTPNRYGEDQRLHCKSIRWLTVFTCMCACVFVRAWICIHSLPWVPYGRIKAPVLAGKRFCIVDSSVMIPLVNLSASDSKPLEAIISDKWKLYMKINIKSFVREKITLLGNKQGTGLRAVLPVIHISTAFKLLKRLEIIIGHIFFPFFSTQMARLGYLTFTSGL